MLLLQPQRLRNKKRFYNENFACRHHIGLGQKLRLTWKRYLQASAPRHVKPSASHY